MLEESMHGGITGIVFAIKLFNVFQIILEIWPYLDVKIIIKKHKLKDCFTEHLEWFHKAFHNNTWRNFVMSFWRIYIRNIWENCSITTGGIHEESAEKAERAPGETEEGSSWKIPGFHHNVLLWTQFLPEFIQNSSRSCIWISPRILSKIHPENPSWELLLGFLKQFR